MARRDQPHHDAPHDEAISQTIWTLQNHRCNIQSGLSTGITTPMEGPQHVSCFSPITLSRNDNTQTKLPRTTPRRHRWRERVGSKRNRGIKTLWAVEEAAILNSMGGIFRSTRFLGTGRRDMHTKSYMRLREMTEG